MILLLTITFVGCVLAAFIEYHIMRKSAEEIEDEEIPLRKRKFTPIMYVKEDELGYEGAPVKPYVEAEFSEN